MARIKIGDWLIEDAALTMSGGRMCLRWAADAWDGTLEARGLSYTRKGAAV